MNRSTQEPKYSHIAKVASRLFRTKGYHATSMKDICDAAGVQRGTLYYYIDTKETLLFNIVDAAIDAVSEGLVQVALSDLPSGEKLRRAVENHVFVLTCMQDETAVLLHETQSLSEKHQREVIEKRDTYEELFCSILDQGIRSGELRSGLNARIACFGILGMVNWLYKWYLPEGTLSPQQIADVFTELLFGGVLSPSSPPTAELARQLQSA